MPSGAPNSCPTSLACGTHRFAKLAPPFFELTPPCSRPSVRPSVRPPVRPPVRRYGHVSSLHGHTHSQTTTATQVSGVPCGLGPARRPVRFHRTARRRRARQAQFRSHAISSILASRFAFIACFPVSFVRLVCSNLNSKAPAQRSAQWPSQIGTRHTAVSVYSVLTYCVQ